MARYDISTRAQALTLQISGASSEEIQRQTGFEVEMVDKILQRAIQRGFNPKAQHPVIFDRYLKDPRNRRSPRRVMEPPTLSSK